MSRRLVFSPGAQPEVRQRGSVYQKGRKQADAWIATERAYGYFRVDVPGQVEQKEVRIALGFCRDRLAALLKLRDEMKAAGALDVEKLRERISPVVTFRSQAAWWLAEMRVGRIVNKKTRKPIRPRTIGGYATAATYLSGVLGDQPLASLDNPEARELVVRMRSEQADGERRFADKTICEYYKVFTQIIASAKDARANQVFPRKWDLAYITLPQVFVREQHRPTLERDEVETILSKVKRPIYAMVAALHCGASVRISELLALEIGKCISSDCTVLNIHQQRGLRGSVEPYPKTDSGFREIDLCPPLASMLREYVGSRKSGFLFCTASGKMLSIENLWRDGFETIIRDMGRKGVSFNSFRRFRESVLQASDCRELLINFWVGHADRDMGSRYANQLVRNAKFRAEWSARVGLGFDIPRQFSWGTGLICDTCDTKWNKVRAA
jgi:integrase